MPSGSRTAASVGLISDTHGLLRPEAIAALSGVSHILHAGDICDPAVLEGLARIAPVTAVRGNNDHGDWADQLRETETLEIAGRRIHVIHNIDELALDPVAAGLDVVVAGHSHKPREELRDGVLYVNPGSAGPRRFSLPIAVARLEISPGRILFQLRELQLVR
jgi:uncharacterized protein